MRGCQRRGKSLQRALQPRLLVLLLTYLTCYLPSFLTASAVLAHPQHTRIKVYFKLKSTFMYYSELVNETF